MDYMGWPELILKNKKVFEILIFHIKKLRNNPNEYKLDIL
jgi:hypothetical protein